VLRHHGIQDIHIYGASMKAFPRAAWPGRGQTDAAE
jgi:hypothetical protein